MDPEPAPGQQVLAHDFPPGMPVPVFGNFQHPLHQKGVSTLSPWCQTPP
jgi:hypothetical protein